MQRTFADDTHDSSLIKKLVIFLRIRSGQKKMKEIPRTFVSILILGVYCTRSMASLIN